FVRTWAGISSLDPLAITLHGETVGFYVPAHPKRIRADLEALRATGERLDARRFRCWRAEAGLKPAPRFQNTDHPPPSALYRPIRKSVRPALYCTFASSNDVSSDFTAAARRSRRSCSLA